MTERRFDLQSKKAPLQEKIREKRRKKLQKTLLFCLAGLILLLALTVTLSHINSLAIRAIDFEGNNVTASRELEQIVRSKLEGRYFYLFARKNTLIFPQREIKQAILDEEKQIAEVQIRRINLTDIVVKVTERQSEFLWCGLEAPVDEQLGDMGGCYFINDQGYIFSEAPYFSGTVYFKVFGLLDTKEKPQDFIGQYVTPPETFKQLIAFKEKLETLSLKPIGLIIKSNNEYALLLEPARWGGPVPKVLFDTESNMETIGHNLETALATAPLRSDIKKRYGQLLYLDLRYKNRVFYKFQ